MFQAFKFFQKLKFQRVPDENEIYLEGAATLKEVSMTYQTWCEYCYV